MACGFNTTSSNEKTLSSGGWLTKHAHSLARMLAGMTIVAVGVYPAAANSFAVATEHCAELTGARDSGWPDPSMTIESSVWRDAGPYSIATPGAPPAKPVTLPEHCEVIGVMRERIGVDGQHYAIRFHLRLPAVWNSEFFFEGGGGSNGVLGDAVGRSFSGLPPALTQGYAVVSQDSGHDNARNSDPARGGAVAFGFDPQARADYGGTSLKAVADAAKAVIRSFYGQAPSRAYFVGCSKGGQEGMVFAQRYPEEFDGIMASAPGFSLPRAAVAEAWDVQSIAAIRDPQSGSVDPLQQLADAISDSDLKLVTAAVLSVCDADDGIQDGIIGNFPACTTARVLPALKSVTCQTDKLPSCLSSGQVRALQRIFDGPHDGKGLPLYSPWQWDAGIAAPGWRLWKMGSADHRIPALNVALGGASLAAVFTTPPSPVSADPAAALHYQSAFDFDRDAPSIYASTSQFTHSAWLDMSARSPDLDRFRARGGKLLVSHGVSDPVFSILDTLAWFREVDRRTHGQANQFVRVFPVPGMNHCAGGPATDRYDAFTALKSWVEQGVAPERIVATSGENSPWPSRSRPLCPYPKVVHYAGHGSVESADSFVCQ